jgi:hypothetical protein
VSAMLRSSKAVSRPCTDVVALFQFVVGIRSFHKIVCAVIRFPWAHKAILMLCSYEVSCIISQVYEVLKFCWYLVYVLIVEHATGKHVGQLILKCNS